jgi:hypothetical protein
MKHGNCGECVGFCDHVPFVRWGGKKGIEAIFMPMLFALVTFAAITLSKEADQQSREHAATEVKPEVAPANTPIPSIDTPSA